MRIMPIKCGFDSGFFYAFKKKLDCVPIQQRRGILVFDEIQVRRSLEVNSRQLIYTGFADLGNEDAHLLDSSTKPTSQESLQLADHELIFLFRPFADSWFQPVGVFSAAGPTKSKILLHLMIKAIVLLESAGAVVDAIVCDGSQTNRGVWKELGVNGNIDKPKNHFTHPVDSNRKVYVFADAPHLLKCIRNRVFKQQELKNGDQMIKWSHFRAVYDEDKKASGNLRVCWKLTRAHIFPSTCEKMRVKLAAQVFSNSMIGGMEFYRKRKVKALCDADGTIQLAQRMNNLFDCMNKRHAAEGVRKDSADFQVLKQSLSWLDNWERQVKSQQINRKQCLATSTANGLRVTILSTIQLTQFLLASGFKYVLTAKFNQDVIERFFEIIHLTGCQNDHPSMPTFMQLYHLLSLYNILKPPNFGNCEVSSSGEKPKLSLNDLKAAFKNDNNSSTKSHLLKLKQQLDGLVEEGSWESDDVIDHDYYCSDVVDYILYYVTGFIVKKCKKFTNCAICQDALQQHKPFSSLPEAELTNMKTKGKLIHPNKHLFNFLCVIENFFSTNMYSVDVYQDTIAFVSQHDVSFPCKVHRQDMLVHIVHYYVLMRMRQVAKHESGK